MGKNGATRRRGQGVIATPPPAVATRYAVIRTVGGHDVRVSRPFPSREQAERYARDLPRDWALTVKAVA